MIIWWILAGFFVCGSYLALFPPKGRKLDTTMCVEDERDQWDTGDDWWEVPTRFSPSTEAALHHLDIFRTPAVPPCGEKLWGKLPPLPEWECYQGMVIPSSLASPARL